MILITKIKLACFDFFSFSFSGMLLAFIQLKQMAKLKKDPQPGKIGYYVFYYYFHRFWRCCVDIFFYPQRFFHPPLACQSINYTLIYFWF